MDAAITNAVAENKLPGGVLWLERRGQIYRRAYGNRATEPKTESMTVNGLNVSTVDVTGVYTAEMAPGSKTFHNDADYRLRAAVIETPKGNYFVKLAGPVVCKSI